MSEFNYVEQPIIPDMPKTVPNEVLHVYVPRATYKIPGIASFSEKYFVLTSKGEVRLVDNIVDIIRNAASKTYVDDSLKSAVNNIDKSLSGKLDQDTSVTDVSKAYVKTPNGTQTTVDISSAGMPNAIVVLDENGQSSIPEPTEDAHIANKEYVDTAAGGKVDKLDPLPNHRGVYTVDSDGKLELIPSTSTVEPYSFVTRSKNGNANIAYPTEDNHIANKKYVDDGLSIKLKLNTTVTDKSQVYVKKDDGTQQMLNLSSGAEPFSVVFVGANGRYSAQYPINAGDVANKQYVDEQIATFDFIKVVNTLPETGLPNRIYLIPNGTSDNQNLFDEWIFVNGKWEWITTKEVEVDLTDYATVEYVDSTMEDTSDALDEIIEIQNTLVDGGNPNTSWLIDKIYPVGSIYMSVNDVDPEVIFGGSWERIQGRFLLGTGPNEENTDEIWGILHTGEMNRPLGEMGGAREVQLTIDQMPHHSHMIAGEYSRISETSEANGGDRFVVADRDEDNSSKWVVGTGGNQAHNNMPPYLAVNIWKRTA